MEICLLCWRVRFEVDGQRLAQRDRKIIEVPTDLDRSIVPLTRPQKGKKAIEMKKLRHKYYGSRAQTLSDAFLGSLHSTITTLHLV